MTPDMGKPMPLRRAAYLNRCTDASHESVDCMRCAHAAGGLSASVDLARDQILPSFVEFRDALEAKMAISTQDLARREPSNRES